MNTPTSVVIGGRKQKLQSIKVEADVFAINPGILGFTGVITIFYRVVGGDRVTDHLQTQLRGTAKIVACLIIAESN